MEACILKVDGLICQWIDGRSARASNSPLSIQPGIYSTLLAPQVPPKDLPASNLFLRTVHFPMSQADKQDPEKGNVIGMFSTALLCHSQIHRPIL